MTLSDAAQGILDTLLTAIRGVDWGQIGTDIATFIKNIDWWGVAGSLLQTIIAAVHGIGSGILSLAADLGKWLWDGFCNGVRDFFSDPIDFLYRVIAEPIINGIKELFGIHSPSTVFAEIGGYLIEGLKNGIAKDFTRRSMTAIPKLFSGLVKAIGNVWTDIKKKAGKAWDGITESLEIQYQTLKDEKGSFLVKLEINQQEVWNGL